VSSRTALRLVVSFLVLAAMTATAGAAAEPAPVDPPSSLVTLDEARERAFAANPEIQALAAQVQAAEGAYRQARAFANPELVIEAEDFGGNLPAEAPTQRTFSLSQSFEWFGRRSARTGAADLARQVAALDLERKRRDIVAEVDRRFSLVLGAQERAAIAGENARTAREVTQAVAALVAAGEVSPIEEARAQADEALADIDHANAARDVDLARRELARLWGDALRSAAGARGRLAETATLPELEGALAAVAELPDLTRWDVEVARQESLHTVAQRQSLPDLALSVGTRSYGGSGGHAYVAGLTLPIPLLTQFAGARAEASARLEQVKQERRAEDARVRVALLAAHETLAQAIDEAQRLRVNVLPKALTIYEALNEGYRRGKFGLLDLLEARRTLAQTRLRYVEALVRLNTADADLRRLAPAPAGANGSGAE
jgi:outer membrane protein, heavy metal efflux system